MISQALAEAAFKDRDYFNSRRKEIVTAREKLAASLRDLGFRVIPSQANFIFAAPPDGDGERCFRFLRENAVVVRYFKHAAGGRYIRITVGTPAECARLLELLETEYGKRK